MWVQVRIFFFLKMSSLSFNASNFNTYRQTIKKIFKSTRKWLIHINMLMVILFNFFIFLFTDFLFSEIDNFSKHARLLQTELTHLDKDKLKWVHNLIHIYFKHFKTWLTTKWKYTSVNLLMQKLLAYLCLKFRWIFKLNSPDVYYC